MSLELRPYQQRLAEYIAKNPERNHLVWLPLGSGKTYVPLKAFEGFDDESENI